VALQTEISAHIKNIGLCLIGWYKQTLDMSIQVVWLLIPISKTIFMHTLSLVKKWENSEKNKYLYQN